MAELNIEKEVINYRNRFLKSILHDLFVKYEKRNLLYVIAECIHEIYGNYPINTEADGSQWLSLDDYDGGLTQRAADLGWTCEKCGTTANVGYRCSWCETPRPSR